MKHTQGPWAIDSDLPPNANPVIARTTYHRIPISADIPSMSLSYEDDYANAKLIAFAPQLLQVLKEALEYQGAIEDARQDWIALARIIIAKVEGENEVHHEEK